MPRFPHPGACFAEFITCPSRHLARIRTGDEEPSPEANRIALQIHRFLKEVKDYNKLVDARLKEALGDVPAPV